MPLRYLAKAFSREGLLPAGFVMAGEIANCRISRRTGSQKHRRLANLVALELARIIAGELGRGITLQNSHALEAKARGPKAMGASVHHRFGAL